MPGATAARSLEIAPPAIGGAGQEEPRPRRTPLGLGLGQGIGLALLLAAALALRLPNLGRLGLVADEGHQALAVRGILDHGVPLVPSGNIYTRGAPFLYAEAAAAAVLGVNELSLRLPAALFGALAVVLVYAYGRMLFGAGIGLIAAFLLTFSLWELELSRYARMYTLLQLVFLGAAITFYKGTIEGRRGYSVLTWLLMAATVVLHPLGLFVILLYALPLFVAEGALPAGLRGRGRWRLALPPAALGSLWFVYGRAAERLLTRTATKMEMSETGAAVAHGSGLVAILRDHVQVPALSLPLELMGRDRPAIAIALVLAAATGLAALPALASRGRRLRALWALAIVGAAFLNLFSIAIGLAVAYLVLLPGGPRELGRRPLGPAVAGAAALALYWGAYLAGHHQVLVTSWGDERTITGALFGYPPLGTRVLSWFESGWPAMTAIVGVTLAVLIARFALDRRRVGCLYAAAIVILPLTAASMSHEIYNESRYHFHLYPFILVVFALAIGTAARLLADAADSALAVAGRPFRLRRLVEVGLAAVLALGLSPDLAPGEIALFFARDYTTPKDPVRSILNWRPYAFFHQDHVSPAAVVRERVVPGDRVLVAGPSYWASIYEFYLGRPVDYVVSEKAERLVRGGVAVHHVTNARILATRAELDQVLAAESGHRIWILGDLNLLGEDSRHFSPELKARLRELCRPTLYVGRDLDTFVARREPVAAGGAASGARE